MSEQEFEEFQRSMSLAQAALKAASKRVEDHRRAEAALEEDEPVHHYRFK